MIKPFTLHNADRMGIVKGEGLSIISLSRNISVFKVLLNVEVRDI
jgi:hypothetical protein